MPLHLASVTAALVVTALGLSLLTSAAHMPRAVAPAAPVAAAATSSAG